MGRLTHLWNFPKEWRAAGSTHQFFNFDPEDPDLPTDAGKVRASPHFTKLEIVIRDLEVMGHPFLAGQSLEDWVHGTTSMEVAGKFRVIEKGHVTIGGILSYFTVSQNIRGGSARTIHVPRGQNMMYIVHHVHAAGSYNAQVFERMIESIQFLR